MIAKDSAASCVGIGFGQQFRQAVPKKDVVAQHHGGRRPVKEILGQQIGLRQTIRRRLYDIGQLDPPLATIPKRALELVLVLRRGDHRDIANPGQHQNRNRVIDHRFVVDRKQLFGHAHRDRIEPRARASGQNDSFAFGHGVSFNSLSVSRRATRQSGRVMPNARVSDVQSIREFAGRAAGVG